MGVFIAEEARGKLARNIQQQRGNGSEARRRFLTAGLQAARFPYHLNNLWSGLKIICRRQRNRMARSALRQSWGGVKRGTLFSVTRRRAGRSGITEAPVPLPACGGVSRPVTETRRRVARRVWRGPDGARPGGIWRGTREGRVHLGVLTLGPRQRASIPAVLRVLTPYPSRLSEQDFVKTKFAAVGSFLKLCSGGSALRFREGPLRPVTKAERPRRGRGWRQWRPVPAAQLQGQPLAPPPAANQTPCPREASGSDSRVSSRPLNF